ncbi:MAG: metalloregulator ArsR/SmtB family transcription factor [Chloroflexi bacterium]|nr:metalloregulator ArsR/SmtB family transcription factor [Chloroflexota bacterium]
MNSSRHAGCRQVQILKALAHPGRLRILFALREADACVCQLTAWLGKRQPYISQQLGYLREAGLVDTRKRGWNVLYHVRDPRIFAVLDRLGVNSPSIRKESHGICGSCHRQVRLSRGAWLSLQQRGRVGKTRG